MRNAECGLPCPRWHRHLACPGAGDDTSRRILRFQKMLDEGLITPEEFEKKRRDILSGM